MGARLAVVVLTVLAFAAAAAIWLQREQAVALRAELALARAEQKDATALRAEHARLMAAQVPETELARLRDDHAAVVRLHGEIDTLTEKLHARERSLAKDPR
ncbi:MAG TPA: hypothetical protein VHD62_18340 [Opitutaceae bacterium]|nr:hypothetical protein [Opitutaceae bacterium]